MSPSFISLPLEIRHEIYGDVFSCQSILSTGSMLLGRSKALCFESSSRVNDGFYCKELPQKVLALLLVNRQISDEAAVYFYGKTTFRAELWHMIRFLRGVGTRRRKIIKRVNIIHEQQLRDTLGEQKIFDLLCTMESLQTIRLERFELLDFRLLQQLLIGFGISNLTGRADISVHHTYQKSTIVQESSEDERILALVRYTHIWSCAKDATEWKELELEPTVRAHWSARFNRWIYRLACQTKRSASVGPREPEGTKSEYRPTFGHEQSEPCNPDSSP